MPKKSKRIHVHGMHCVSCETLIADKLKEIGSVVEATVCHKKKCADICFHGHDLDLDEVSKKLGEVGYSIHKKDEVPTRKKSASPDQWFYAFFIVLLLYFFFKFLTNLGLFNWLEVYSANISVGIAFLIGIVASVSTCLAVVGGVVLSFAAKFQSTGNFFQANIKPHLMFHVGRWASFFLLGGLLGIVGSWFNISGSAMGWFTIIIALVLFWLGLNMLGITPSMSTVGIRMPKSTMKTWSKLKDSNHAFAPVALGAFSFFLPCGFTQSMQLFAVSTGSFWVGGLTLLFFAIGTSPVLLGLGFAASRFKNMKLSVFQLAIGMVVIMFGISTLFSGLALAGIDISLPAPSSGGSGTVIVEDDVQVVQMTADYRGYTPSTFYLKKDIPVRWEINATQVSGCTDEIIVPDYNITQPLESGMNIIEFIPTRSGTIGFSCWMGMVRGKFIVE